MRPGTCVEDRFDAPPEAAPEWRSTCGHGNEWRMGDLRAACEECLLARCDHPKEGLEVEQGRLL